MKNPTPMDKFNYEMDDIIFDAQIQALKAIQSAFKFPIDIKRNPRITEALTAVRNRIPCLGEIQFKHPGYVERLNSELKHFSELRFDDFVAIPDIRSFGSVDSVIAGYKNKSSNKDLGRAKKAEFVFKCSNGDCRGLVDTEFECQLCHASYCPNCFQLLHTNDDDDENAERPEHVCNPNDIAAAKMILASTKPCPNCAARIYKIDGCSQMFCTNCHVGFDWNTGKLIHSNFHNPHRLAWLRENNVLNMNEPPQDCHGGNPTAGLRRAPYALSNNFEWSRRCQEILHFEQLTRSYRTKIDKIDDDLFKNRCLYIINDMSKKDYMEYLTHNIKTHHRLNMIYNIYDGYVEIVRTIMLGAIGKYKKFEKLICDEEFKAFDKSSDSSNRYSASSNISTINAIWCQLEMNHDTRQFKELMFSNEYSDAIEKGKPLCEVFASHMEQTLLDPKRPNPKNTINYNTIKPKTDEYIGLCVKLFQQMPIFEDEIDLLTKITNETRNEISLYKSIFNISSLTMPIIREVAMESYERNHRSFVPYYVVH